MTVEVRMHLGNKSLLNTTYKEQSKAMFNQTCSYGFNNYANIHRQQHDRKKLF